MDKEPLKIKLNLAIKNLNDIYKLAVDDNAIQKITMRTIMLLEDCESDMSEKTHEDEVQNERGFRRKLTHAMRTNFDTDVEITDRTSTKISDSLVDILDRFKS